jgi:hypothetical protein
LTPRKPEPSAAIGSGSETGAHARALIEPRWAKVERIRLIRREVRESLGLGAIDLLLAHGDLVVEGGEAIASDCGRVYATLMVTIDLSRCAERVREPADVATAERLVELLRDAASLRVKLAELARPHLAALAGLAPEAIELSIQPSVRSDRVALLIDGDAVAWARGHEPTSVVRRS